MTAFLEVWIGYAILGTLAFSVMFVWAVRNRQFTDFERANRIALNAAEPIEEPRQCSGIDRYTPIAIAIVTLIVIVVTIWVALANSQGVGCGTCH